MEYLSHYYVVTIYSLSESEGIVAHNWGISSQSSWLKKIYDSIPWFNKKIGKYFSYWPNEVENLTFSLALLPKLLKERYDIFFPVSIWGVLIGRLVRTLVGTKIVYVNHGGAENFILFQKPDRFIALTPDVFDWAQQKHAEVDSRWIPCGVDLKRFNPHIKPASLSLEKPVFLCVAAATAYKNIETTIQAVSGLKKGSLLVIAKGEREKEIEKLAKADDQKGLTLVPISVYSKGRLIKVSVAIGKGKKTYNKRETIKKREAKKNIERIILGMIGLDNWSVLSCAKWSNLVNS